MTEEDEEDVIKLTEYRDTNDLTKQEHALKPDPLRDDLCRRHKEANDLILVASRMIAPSVEGADWEAGYR